MGLERVDVCVVLQQWVGVLPLTVLVPVSEVGVTVHLVVLLHLGVLVGEKHVDDF